MRHATLAPTADKIIYEVSEYTVLVGGILELLTCCFIFVACLFPRCAELRTGFYMILSIGLWIDGAWTLVYFIYKSALNSTTMLLFTMDVQMFAVLMIGPWILILALNRYVAMVLPQKYDIHFSAKRTQIYGGSILLAGIFYIICRHAGVDETLLVKLGQNLTTGFCIIAFCFALESIRSQKKCEWRKQIEDRKLLYLTLTITTFQLIANIMSAYVITWETILTWHDWQLSYFFTGINMAIFGAQFFGVILLFVFSQPAKDTLYRMSHCQEPLHNRIRPLAFIE